MKPKRRHAAQLRLMMALGVLLGGLLAPNAARAGSLGWLDEVVQQVIRETEVGGRAVARAEGRAARTAGRLFVKEADESMEALAKRSDAIARIAGRLDEPAETALTTRFNRLVKPDADMARTFAGLAPAERRLVVEMGEAAQTLARRYPGQADTMIRRLGVEGLTAVRVYGDDVAEVIVKEGPESLNVVRKAGRGGWRFFTEKVLPNKGKLAAAGVLAVFLANPEKFVDTAGQATQFAVEQFAKAGIGLAGAVSGGAARGLERAVGGALATVGLDHPVVRWAVIAACVLVAVMALLVMIGMPARLVLRPFTWPWRVLTRRRARHA